MTGISDDDARLTFLLGELEGLPCFSTIVGGADDYALVLDLGEKRRRSLRLANPRLSFLQRTFEGDSGLLIECPWRIDAEDQVIASCFDRRGEGERGSEAVNDLVERTVLEATAEAPGWDLVVRLSGGWTVRAFALEPAPRPPRLQPASAGEKPRVEPPAARAPRSNWAVWTPAGSMVVGPGGQLHADPPDGGGGGDARWRMRLAARHGSNDG